MKAKTKKMMKNKREKEDEEAKSWWRHTLERVIESSDEGDYCTLSTPAATD